MAMATRASLFIPTILSASKPSNHAIIPWKQPSFISISGPKPQRAIKFAAAAAEEKTEATTKEAPIGFTPPELDKNTPSLIFGGSTGGLLRKAQVEEFYVVTLDSPKEQIFEMPTGGAAITREGPNLLKLATKEQCSAPGTRLRSKYKIKYQGDKVWGRISRPLVRMLAQLRSSSPESRCMICEVTLLVIWRNITYF